VAERPILFSAPMVRAILSSQKTVTRRVCQEMPTAPGLHDLGGGYGWNGNVASPALVKYDERGVSVWPFRASRCGGVGDRLWVRETWCPGDYWTSGVAHDPPEDIRYAADNSAISYATGKPLRIDTSDWSDPKRWRPSIHMPRWASRLSLDVVSVGVERLHDIDDEGATREGIRWWSKDGALRKYAPADDEGDGPMWPWRDCPRSPREAFERLWTEVYGPGAWAANPWVWRVEFERAEARCG